MAKPINPYQGAAPAAMAQMGQGLAETGASIARSIQSGYDALGRGLAGGIQSAASSIAGAMGEKRQLESGIKSSEKLYDSIKDSIDPTLRKSFDTQIAAMNADTSLSTQDKAMFWNDAKSFIGNAVSNQAKMQLQGMQEGGAMARTQAQIGAELARQQERLLAQQKENELRFLGGMGTGVTTPISPMTYGIKTDFSVPALDYYGTPIKGR